MVRSDGVDKLRPMKKEDFDNIQISALNFKQARKCKIVDGFIDSKGQILNTKYILKCDCIF